MTYFYISPNILYYAGSITSSIRSLSALTFLSLHTNSLKGEIVGHKFEIRDIIYKNIQLFTYHLYYRHFSVVIV